MMYLLVFIAGFTAGSIVEYWTEYERWERAIKQYAKDKENAESIST